MMNANMVRWLATYLRDQKGVCLFQGAVSLKFKYSGVPQGLVLSPQLFNYFVSDCPNLAQVNSSYASNLYLLESSPDVSELGPKLTEYLTSIAAWAEKNKLTIAPSKSYVILFTPWTKEVNRDPGVSFLGNPIRLIKLFKALGINLSSLLKSSPQSKIARTKSSPRLQLLKDIDGQDWGDKETLLLTYNTLVKPVITNGAPIWYPSNEPDSSAIQGLQRVQNNPMQIITGAHRNNISGLSSG
jgi:hypothetical protein